MREPPTAQGVATRARIVVAAAELVSRRGVAATSLDDVRAASATSKSQLYHYFGDKAGLVLAVVEHHRDTVLAGQALLEEPLDSLAALHRWRLRTLAAHRRDGLDRPCPIGRLAAELGNDDPARLAVRAALDTWRAQLATGLHRMQQRAALRPEAEPEALAAALLGAVQGGRLLSATVGDITPLRWSLDAVIARVAELTTQSAHEPRVGSSTRTQPGTT
ncbi:MAG TPA: TetR/AcrR family transcriptional regulator [Kineosporiaceae bacterium]